MVGLACVRLGLGAVAWLAPRAANRAFALPRSEDSPALLYMNRVFGVRAIALGLGYVASRGEARRLWHRLWLLCDVADTAMGAAMVARGELAGPTAIEALTLTGVSAAVDVAALER
jgi:hypothetical protein